MYGNRLIQDIETAKDFNVLKLYFLIHSVPICK